MNDMPRCCRECRGIVPHYFCTDPYRSPRHPGCTCHQKQDALARRKQDGLYKDLTATTAIGNVMKGRKK